MSTGSPGTFTNPVYPGDFPDPFVLRFNGRYYAYATSPVRVTEAGQRVFPILSSTDLVHWTEHGPALPALDTPGLDAYWAPEVAYHDGRFYMYYAAGNDADPNHHLRVAIAEHPLGPWQDAGKNLTPEEFFAIDAHPFRDPRDGRWYLYYARDALVSPYAGTGLAVDELTDMVTLAGKPVDVLRPFAEWQVFELKRAIKQDLDWYTVEGPFVMPVCGRYVCFYSGGRWENPNYGVNYALADHPLGPWVEEAGAEGPKLLRTMPGEVVGPGHNSVVLGPDLSTWYIVYHGWDLDHTGRSPRIDRLTFDGCVPLVHGPTCSPQPVPRPADFACWFDGAEPGPEWERDGVWTTTPDGAKGSGGARLSLQGVHGDFVAETSIRSVAGGGGGLRIGDLAVSLDDTALRVGMEAVALPAGTRIEVWHRLLIRRAAGKLTATLDDYPTVSASIPEGPARIALAAGPGAEFSHFALTRREG